MARALAAALLVSLLAVSGAGGTDAQTPRRGGTVVFGPVSEPSCLNPLVVTCASNDARGTALFWIAEKVLTPAFAVAPDFTMRPKLVSRVTFTRAPPFTLTYHIRPEARWSDGVPVSAEDFVFTHQAIRKHLPAGRGDSGDVHLKVRSIRAVDAKTVRVVLRSRAAEWRTLFAFVLARHALAGEDLGRIWSDRIDNPKTGVPIGSGPFLVERWERGKKQLTLRRNPRYWGSHPAYLDRLVVRFCKACFFPQPAEVLDAVRQGEVNFALSRDTSIVPELRGMPGIRVLPMRSTGWEHLDLRIGSGGHPGLRSKLVRRALAYGIDRVAIVRRLFGEIDPKYPPSDSAAFLNTSRYYRPSWSGYRYRPDLARRLLEESGCRRGADGIYVCAGQKLSLRFVAVAGVRLRELTLELLQAQLRQVGVEVSPTFAPPPALFSQILPDGVFDAALFSWFGGADSIGGNGVFGCGGPQNYMGYCQRLVTRDLNQANLILDEDQRARVLNRADAQIANDVPVIPLYQIPFVLALRTTIRNFASVALSPLSNAEEWWLER